MASSMFWKIFSYYLPIFYSDIFNLSLTHTATLMFVTRVWDAVSDPMMGAISDRTNTRWGKYRPYLLWFSLPFAVSGVLLFTTPDCAEQGRLVYAYITYILMMTVYTCINVPYASMLGVITSDSYEKTVFSSYRMFFAYSRPRERRTQPEYLHKQFCTPPFCTYRGDSSDSTFYMLF